MTSQAKQKSDLDDGSPVQPHSLGVGAVVIGRNEGERLLRCLQSLVSDCDSVVYVDSGSSDGSAEAAANLGAKVVELDLSTPFTAARARNVGFERLKEEHGELQFVQFVDGDCEVLPGWLNNATHFLHGRPDVTVVCGRRFERHPTASIYNAMCHREWDTPIGQANACGGDFLIRGAAFRQVHGFASEQIAHEEPEFCGRLRAAGYGIWRMDQPMTLHDAAIYRFIQFYRRNRRAGFGITQAVVRSGWNIDPGGRSILRRAFTWSVLIPLVIAALALLFGPWALLLLLIYPGQVLRHALINQQRADGGLMNRIKVAGLAMSCKFAETHGSLEFLGKYLMRRRLSAIYYK